MAELLKYLATVHKCRMVNMYLPVITFVCIHKIKSLKSDRLIAPIHMYVYRPN